MHAVSLVVVDRHDRRVDRDFVEVRSSEPAQLRVQIGVDAARQQRVVAEVDARHHVRHAERDLLGLREEVVRIAIEDHASDALHRDQLFGNDLGGIEHVEREGSRFLLREGLDAELVLGTRTAFDRFPKIAAMEVRIRAGDLDRLVPVE